MLQLFKMCKLFDLSTSIYRYLATPFVHFVYFFANPIYLASYTSALSRVNEEPRKKPKEEPQTNGKTDKTPPTSGSNALPSTFKASVRNKNGFTPSTAASTTTSTNTTTTSSSAASTISKQQPTKGKDIYWSFWVCIFSNLMILLVEHIFEKPYFANA